MPQEPHPNPYEVLAISRDATAGEVHRAYRRAARAAHPDRQPDDPGAPVRFAAIASAYETLRDPRRRAAYDRGHPVAATPDPPAARHSIAVRILPSQQRLAGRPALWAGPVHITPPRGG